MNFHLYSAADGNGLDGRHGTAGIVHVCWKDDDTYEAPRVAFYPGAAAAHAIQMNVRHLSHVSIGFLGGFARTGVLFDPLTLAEIKPNGKRIEMRDDTVPLEILWQSQTHVAWIDSETFYTPIGEWFVAYTLTDAGRPVRKGRHGVWIPHGLKVSPSGSFIVYGAMDHNYLGPSRRIGIYNIAEQCARVVHLDETVWHIATAIDPVDGEEYIYAVSECYEPGPPHNGMPYNYDDLAIGYRTNYIWKIAIRESSGGERIEKIAAPPILWNHLSSDVLSLGDANDTVIHNCCASSAIAFSEMRTGRIRHIDERVCFVGGSYPITRHPSLLRAVWGNLVEAFSMMHIPGNTHHLIRALRVSRGSLLDGSYGLVMNPQKTRLFAGHRGLNQIIVYDLTSIRDTDGPILHPRIVARIQLPALASFFQGYLGRSSDPRLGLHHMTYLIEEES